MPHIAPWQHVRKFDNALRRLLYNPATLFGPYVKPGMTVMDVGCGAGFNCLALARLVGKEGRVLAVDLQQECLDMLETRAEKAGLADRIETHHCEADAIGIEETVAFVNAFWMVHEVPDAREFLRQVHSCLQSGGKFFVAEPSFHVSEQRLQDMVATAQDIGFDVHGKPRLTLNRCVVFSKTRE